MNKLGFLHLFLVSLFAIIFLGCGDQQEATSISTPKNVNTIKLAKVLQQTSDYAGKNIVIDGNFFPACSNTKACCSDEFVLKSGINQINVIKMGDFKAPNMKTALPIRVTGILKETAQSPFIQATNIEIR